MPVPLIKIINIINYKKKYNFVPLPRVAGSSEHAKRHLELLIERQLPKVLRRLIVDLWSVIFYLLTSVTSG